MDTQAGNDQSADTPRPLRRITRDPQVMKDKACIRGMRVTVGMIVGLNGAGRTIENVLNNIPDFEREDELEAIQYAAWLSQKRKIVLETG